MVSDNPPYNRSANQPPSAVIPVHVDQVDQLVLVARDLAGFLLILDAATGDATLAAVERILIPINEKLQEFKNWFQSAWHLANAQTGIREMPQRSVKDQLANVKKD